MIAAYGKALLAIAFLIPCTSTHRETSDLEDTQFLKLEKVLNFKNASISSGNRFTFPTEHALYGDDGGPGTSNWAGTCATGQEQSPVDVTPYDTYRAVSQRLRFYGVHQVPISTNMTNSGHSVKIKLKTPKPILATGGVLGDKVYEFQSLHFHWGADVYEGAEHTFNSKSLPLECHFVFQREGCKDPTTEKDALVVMAVHYNLGWKNNQVLEPVVKALVSGRLEKPQDFILKSGGIELRDYMPGDLQTYFAYRGSLTTPPCTEGVTWVIFSERQLVSGKQVSKFRRIKDELGLKVEYNYRETQPLNGRRIFLVTPPVKTVYINGI
uniref:carbonic anhydrase n=1 Tax=Lygus hesperus TaxID=30085 RepID=A0A0A9W7J1_LYGHE